MYKFLGIVLLSALAAVGGKRIIMNEPLDIFMKHVNDQQRLKGFTSAPIPEIPLDSNVKYSEAVLLGVDSMQRTADCWQEIEGNDVTFDFHYGFGMLTVVLPHLEIAGTNMSAYARIRNNTVHLSFTVQGVGKECHVKLNELRVEKMGNVEFGASRPEYDDTNLEGFFKLAVVPTLNGIVDSNFARIEASLQSMCKVTDFRDAGYARELVASIL